VAATEASGQAWWRTWVHEPLTEKGVVVPAS
jgi:hypothetical protein